MPMRIAFFGSSLVSAYWNGAATYYRGLLRALAARGHHITFYEPDALDRQAHRDISDPDWVRVVVYGTSDDAAVRGALQEAAGADLVVKASGVGIFDALLEEGVAALRAPHRAVAFWDVDAPATLHRLHTQPDDPLRRHIPGFDIVLTYGGGAPVVEAYRKLDARRCVPIYNAVDPATHHPVVSEPRFEADLSFLGNRLPDRERRVEQFLLDVAQRRPRQRFLLGGSGWEDKPKPSNVRYVGHVYTRDHNAFNCSAGAVLNISRDSMAENGHSPATRVFEAAGAGACIVTDAWDGIEQFLEPGREVLVAADTEEVVAHLDTLTPIQRDRIGRAARRRVLSDHTYDHRARQLEEVLWA